MSKQGVKLNLDKQTEQYRRYYNQYVQELTSLLITQFEYYNLPETLDARIIEQFLIGKQGQVAFFYDSNIDGLLQLPCVGKDIGLYGDPINFEAYSDVGYRADVYFNILDIQNSTGVVMYDGPLHNNPVWNTIDLYSKRLALIQVILDNHTRLAHQAPILLGSQDQLLSLKNLMQAYDNQVPYIIADQRFDPQAVKLLEFSKTFNGEALLSLYDAFRSDALKHCGIIRDYVQNKTERQITAEVNMANSESFEVAYTRLSERQKAVKYINRIFGTDIEVDFRNMTYKSEYTKNDIGGDQSDLDAEQVGQSEPDTDLSV